MIKEPIKGTVADYKGIDIYEFNNELFVKVDDLYELAELNLETMMKYANDIKRFLYKRRYIEDGCPLQ